MKRFSKVLATGAFLLSAQASLADTCFYEELSPTLKTFGFTTAEKNFSEVASNRLIAVALAQSKGAWLKSMPTATVTCFASGDSVPTLLQKLEVYQDKFGEFKVRASGF